MLAPIKVHLCHRNGDWPGCAHHAPMLAPTIPPPHTPHPLYAPPVPRWQWCAFCVVTSLMVAISSRALLCVVLQLVLVGVIFGYDMEAG